MIRHSVVFKLRHAAGSPQEANFLATARSLATIPTVRSFECLRQISAKCRFDFGLSMEFADARDYEIYNNHPLHVRFVETRWVPEVAEFMEIDYEPYLLGARS
jgi:hypothetical protein